MQRKMQEADWEDEGFRCEVAESPARLECRPTEAREAETHEEPRVEDDDILDFPVYILYFATSHTIFVHLIVGQW